MRRKRILASGLCVVLASGCAMLSSGAMADVDVGDTAPNIGAGAWWNLPEGLSAIRSKDLRGRIVVLDFWATW